MKNLVIVGTQWGDEGKGKIVDLAAPAFDAVIRTQGGDNAGHTVVVGQQVLKLHLIPSGILHPDIVCVLGNGMVINPYSFSREVTGLEEAGIAAGPANLKVSRRANLIMPYHLIQDQSKGSVGEKIDSTKRGIGPAYEDKIGRRGVRVGDLFNYEVLRDKVKEGVARTNLLLGLTGLSQLDAAQITDEYFGLKAIFADLICDTASLLNSILRQGGNILLEGAQGAGLDVDFGTVPCVTSSNATAGGACTGSGISPRYITDVLAVAKAYTTRVGRGAFPTEQDNDLGAHIRERGNEYGTSTGRPRRCGFFDAVMTRYGLMINGASSVAITKLDVLDKLFEIQVCIGYRLRGVELPIEEFPYSDALLEAMEPIYETLPGWQCSTAGVNEFGKLPRQAQDYVKRLSDLLECEVSVVSTGPDRQETIIRPGMHFDQLLHSLAARPEVWVGTTCAD